METKNQLHLYNMKKIITIIIILSITNNSFSQTKTQYEDSIIAKHMQNNADTTIIVQYPNVWSTKPQIFLLSKYRDTIAAYLYADLRKINFNKKIPRKIALTIYSKTLYDFQKAPIEINQYFNVKDIEPDSLIKFWSEVAKLKLWSVKDDAVEGRGCPIDRKQGFLEIDDAGGTYVLLITKSVIKPLNFYAPEEYETFCPGRKGRRTILKLADIFRKNF